MPIAIWSRRYQFCAGPQTHAFAACASCAPEVLRDGWLPNGLFFTIAGHGPAPVDPQDEVPCDLCQEGGRG
jgi:hypothetical protein